MTLTRSPIICVMGHVDHGKTTLLDSVRGTAVAKKEAGAITQMIGASYVERKGIESMARSIAERMRFSLKIPGLLFIDTPGHEAFSNLRDRGGSIADLAVLVIDVNQGLQPQTIESIKILKTYKTPFIIAANKIDAMGGWKSNKTVSFMESLAKQPEHVQQALDMKLYEIMGKLSEHGFDSERFDRVTEFGRQLAIVPMSAKTKEGLGELLMIIAGLSQKFLGSELEIQEGGRGKGSIIEVKEEKGLGTTLDVIIYDGVLRKNDEVLFMSHEGVKRTKLRGILLPCLSGKEKYLNIDSAVAAAGVRLCAPDFEGAIPGSPIEVVKDYEDDRRAIESQFKSIVFEKKDELGLIVRADSLGSVEALLKLLEAEEIPVRDAGVGKVSRKDVIGARVVGEQDPLLGLVLAFNVEVLDDARIESKESGTRIIASDIIYKVIENYQEWVEEEKERSKRESMTRLTWPGKIKVLDGFVFRACKPAVFGIEVLAGKIKNHIRLTNKAGDIVGQIKDMQKEKEKVDEATPGDQLAISCEGIHIGKNVTPGEVLYAYLTPDEIKGWDEAKGILQGSEKEALEEIRRIHKRYF